MGKYPFERKPNAELWEHVRKYADNDEEKIKAVQIIFQQQYELPEESIELVQKLASSEQPKNVRLEIAKSLFENEHIPFGMYRSLMSILSDDPDLDVKKLLSKTDLRQINAFSEAMKKIQPAALTESIRLLSSRQNEIKKILYPFVEFQKSPLVKTLVDIQKSPLVKSIAELQKSINLFNFDSIKIPTVQFDIGNVPLKDVKELNFSTDSVLSKVAKEKPEVMVALESKHKIDESNETLTEMEQTIQKLITPLIKSQDNIGNNITNVAKEQKNIANTINRKLSPTTTIGIALVVGIASSFLGSALFKIWTDVGNIISDAPIIVNSTIPIIVNSTIPIIVNSTMP